MTNTNETHTPSDVDVTQSAIEYTDANVICISGYPPIEIPQLVKQRPPLSLNDGMVNRSIRPAYDLAPINICINVAERKFAFVDGQPLTRAMGVGSTTKKKLFIMMATCREIIERKNLEYQSDTYDSFNISLCITPDWVFFNIVTTDECHIRLHQDNARQFVDMVSIVKQAYVYTRALILDMSAVGIVISGICEDDFSRFIIKLILKSCEVTKVISSDLV